MTETLTSWLQSLKAFAHPRVVTMFFYGFSAGLPLLLIFSSLSLWLREAGVDRSTVTYFSWAALAYSFKFVWAPLIDRLPILFLTRRLGRRRAWLLIAQLLVVLSIFLVSQINPAQAGALQTMALAVVLLGFSSATQDIVIDAYRIESAGQELQAMMSSSYIVGYRVGMVVSGAGSLLLASYFGSSSEHYSYSAWHLAYLCMALAMFVGVITTLVIREPELHRRSPHQYSSYQYLKFLGVFVLAVLIFIGTYLLTGEPVVLLKATLSEWFHNEVLANLLVEAGRLGLGVLLAGVMVMLLSKTSLYEPQLVNESYIAPVRDFFKRYGVRLAWLLLMFVGLYRISDIVLGVISNIFYQDLGFTKVEIAKVVKTFGLVMTIVGGFLGGILAMRHGIIRVLYLGAVLSAFTNLLFVALAYAGPDIRLLYVVISADNMTAGLASAAFVAFLSRLTNVSFTAMQYAIFSSLMTLVPKTIGGYSGSMVDSLGYPAFFLMTTLMGLPVLLLIHRFRHHDLFRE